MKNSKQPYVPDWQRALSMARAAPRCAARCRHTKAPCKGPAMAGKRVCRLHGGKGGAPCGEANGNYRHGRTTAEAIERRRKCRAAIQEVRRLIRIINATDSEVLTAEEGLKNH